MVTARTSTGPAHATLFRHTPLTAQRRPRQRCHIGDRLRIAGNHTPGGSSGASQPVRRIVTAASASYRIMIYPTTAKITNTAAVTIMVVLDIQLLLDGFDAAHRPELLYPCSSRPGDPLNVIDCTSVEQVLEVHGVVLPFPDYINQCDVAHRGITFHCRACRNRDEHCRNVPLNRDNGSQECQPHGVPSIPGSGRKLAGAYIPSHAPEPSWNGLQVIQYRNLFYSSCSFLRGFLGR